MKLKSIFLKRTQNICFSAILLALLLSTSAAEATAAPGEIDADFGSYGSVLTEFERGTTAQVVLVQPDRKIIIAGTTGRLDDLNKTFITVLRFNPDGSPDPGFGTNGQVFTSILSRNTAQAGVLQPDGKFIIAGWVFGTSPANKIGLVRYNPDGSLDTGFGDAGKVITDFDISMAPSAHSLLLQPDGKIVLLGDNESFDILLSRYNSNGVLDGSFGNGGKVVTRYVSEGNEAKSARLQPDGKIVLGGWINTADSASNSAVFRYTADGTLDSSFDNDGVAVKALSSSHDRIREVLIRPDGKILTVGTSVIPEQNSISYAIALYNSDGSPDANYGQNGVSVLPAPGLVEIENALLQSDGKVTLAGTLSYSSGARYRFHLARFEANGAFDFTFGNGGKVNFPIGHSNRASALAVQSDNKLLIAGVATTLSSRKGVFALTRFQGGNGQVPTSAFISGRVVDDTDARGVGGVTVKLSGAALTAPRYARTNPFGFYRFADLPVNTEYDLTVIAKNTPSFQTSVHLLLNGNEYAEDLLFRR
jgi:uncharacterized delta-60 repeat protein